MGDIQYKLHEVKSLRDELYIIGVMEELEKEMGEYDKDDEYRITSHL